MIDGSEVVCSFCSARAPLGIAYVVQQPIAIGDVPVQSTYFTLQPDGWLSFLLPDVYICPLCCVNEDLAALGL